MDQSHYFQNQKDNFLRAIQTGDFLKVKEICDDCQLNPKDVSKYNNLQWTALHYAARFNNSDITEYLIRLTWENVNQNEEEYQKAMNQGDFQNNTPFMIACHYESEISFQVFLQFGGINFQIKNKKGYTALDICRINKFKFGIDRLNNNQLESNLKPKIEMLSQKFQQKSSANSQYQSVQSSQQQQISNNFGKNLSQIKSNQQESIKQLFEDKEFPHQVSTICTNPKNKDYKSFEEAIWYRPQELFGTNDFKLFDNIEPDDITQGILGVCYLLASLSSLALSKDRIQKIFVDQTVSDIGKYTVNFYKNGIPTQVYVDDCIPCNKDTNDPLFSKPNGKELWVMILEKAWAKLFGTYVEAESMQPSYALEEVLGCPTYTLFKNFEKNEKNEKDEKKKNLKNGLLSATKHHYIVVAATSKINQKELSLINLPDAHAYSILDVKEIENQTIIKIRNPWGHSEIKGIKFTQDLSEYNKLSQDEKQHQEKVKKEFGMKNVNDGTFLFTLEELSQYFSYIYVACYRIDAKYKWITYEQYDQNIEYYISFEIKKAGRYCFRLHQPFNRYKEQKQEKFYLQNPCIFQLQKQNGQIWKTKYVMDEDYKQDVKTIGLQENQTYLDLEIGSYQIMFMIKQKNHSKPIIISSYSDESDPFEKIKQKEIPKLSQESESFKLQQNFNQNNQTGCC